MYNRVLPRNPRPVSERNFDTFKIYSVGDGVYHSEGSLPTIPDFLSEVVKSPNVVSEVRVEGFVYWSGTGTLVFT